MRYPPLDQWVSSKIDFWPVPCVSLGSEWFVNRFYIVRSRYGNLMGPVEQNNCIKFELNPLGFRACSVMAALEGQ